VSFIEELTHEKYCTYLLIKLNVTVNLFENKNEHKMTKSAYVNCYNYGIPKTF
jgi:hypothetical protein